MKLKALLNNKKFRHGSLATLITVFVIVVAVLINIVCSMLIDRFDLRIDITQNQIYELDQQTLDYLSSYEQPTTIYVLAGEDEFRTASDEYTQVYNILKKYPANNSNIKLEFIDLMENPSFATQYADAELSAGDVLVVGDNGRYRSLTSSDLFRTEYDYTTYQVSAVYSLAEQSVDGALEYIEGKNPVHAVVTEGHQESDISSITTNFEVSNYEFETANLTMSDLSADYDLVIIASPTVDFTEEEIAKLDSFLDNGGELGKSVIYLGSATQPALPNLEAFLAKWGIQMEDGAVYEMNTQMVASASGQVNPFILYAFPSTSEYASSIDTSLPLLVPYIKPMTAVSPEDTSTMSTVSIAKTSETCVRVPSDINETWQPNEEDQQTYEIAMAGVKQNGDVKSQVIAFSSLQMLAYYDQPTLSNGDLVTAVWNTAADKADSLQLTLKSLTASSLGMTISKAYLLTGIFVLALPLATIIVGLVIWLRRRHR